MLFNYLLHQHSDSLIYDLLGQEILQSKYFNSASLIELPKDGTQVRMYFTENRNNKLDDQIIEGHLFSDSLLNYIGNIKETKTIFWSSKYRITDLDDGVFFSMFTPVFEDMKLTGIIVCNIDKRTIKSFVSDLKTRNTHVIH